MTERPANANSHWQKAHSEIATVHEKCLRASKALAILHNTEAVILSGLVLMITWNVLAKEIRWGFWIVLLAGLLSHIVWFYSDTLIGNRTMVVNIALSSLFAAGVALAGFSLYR